jgi:hypothetical protein
MSYEKFTAATIKVAQSLIRPVMGADRTTSGLTEVFENTMFDLSGPRTLDRPQLTPLQTFQEKLFYQYLEIDKSFNALKDIELYVGRFPYKGAVSRPNHLRYHVENHLHEIYVLRERLVKYVKVVRRAYRSDPTAAEIRYALQALEAFIEKSLGGIVVTRGNHVHHARFTDKDLDRVDFLDFVTLHTVEPKTETANFRRYYLQEYRKIRKKWRATIRGNNAAINALLNSVGDVFLATVYSAPEQTLRPPGNL